MSVYGLLACYKQAGRCEMANTFNVSKLLISRLWNRYQQTQNVDDQPHSGYARATIVQDLQNRFQMANQIVANLIRLFVSELRVRQDLSSCSTVRVCTYHEKSSHCPVMNGVHEQSMLTPAAVHVLNGSRPFTPLKLSGHDRETCVLTSKATNNVS